MPRNPKIALNRTVLFVSSSVEEGLMFPPNPLIKLLLLKSLAQAQALHPVRISHFLFEATHVHLILSVDNPDDVKGFMERFKTESAHAVNRLLGRKKRTVWCDGYDSPTVLDLEKAIEQIVYLYENPAKDGLVDSIRHYPALSSWHHFKKGKTVFPTHLISRDSIRKLDTASLNLNAYRQEVKRLTVSAKAITFRIFPDAWLETLGVNCPRERKRCNEEIESKVAAQEAHYREERKRSGVAPIGAGRLQLARIGRSYQPEREGKKMICLGSSKEIRAPFIEFAKELFQSAKEVMAMWKQGDVTVPYPLGLYPPAFPKLAEPLVFE